MDFTRTIYKTLLTSLQSAGYVFFTFEDYLTIKETVEKFVILRHDIDTKAGNALAVAKVEAALGIRASYYFRIVPQSNQPEIIKKIAAMKHEIGYHYENMDMAFRELVKNKEITKGDIERIAKELQELKDERREMSSEQLTSHLSHLTSHLLHTAYEDFKKNLKKLREFASVKTICMHGSPRSPFDSKDLWNVYNYKDFGILGEPYFDIDFSRLFYLTDTGRRWDGYKVSVRDKIPQHQERWIQEGKVYHNTQDILHALTTHQFPPQLMLTTHPQRWTNNKLQWGKELLLQNVKNVVKAAMIRRK